MGTTSQIAGRKKKRKPMEGFYYDIKNGRRVWLGRQKDGSWHVCFTAPRKAGDNRPAALHRIINKDGKRLAETRLSISVEAMDALINLRDYIKNNGVITAQWIVVTPDKLNPGPKLP